LLFFGSLIVHELGHAVAARREGVGVSRIELFLFGGTTHMSREAKTPGEEFRIAVAGPLGTLLVLLVCVPLLAAIVGSDRLVDAVRLETNVPLTPVQLSLSWLVPMNLLILVFNLVPAYPLDGGRIARASSGASRGTSCAVPARRRGSAKASPFCWPASASFSPPLAPVSPGSGCSSSPS